MPTIENLNNYRNNVVELLRDVQTVLGDSPAAQSAIADLTDSSGGTADDTVAAISGSGADADINNNFADLSAKVNAILSALRTIGLIET